MKLYFYVSVVYSVVNSVLASIILIKSRRTLLSRFYAFCVTMLVILGVIWQIRTHSVAGIPSLVLEHANAFLYALFPFFFFHFMLVFLRRYEIVKSKQIIFATYFAGLFSYTLVLLHLIPLPFSPDAGISATAYIYYITWMSMLFAIGVALLYSLIGGFGERGMHSNLLFFAFALLMLLLPTPFTLSIFSVVSENSFVWYFVSSTLSLAIIVYLVFRHKITMNTPYQAMKSALAAMNDVIIKTDIDLRIEMVQGAVLPLLGYQEKELLQQPLTNFIQQKSHVEQYRELSLQEKAKEYFFDADVICRSGDLLPMEFSFTPVYGSEEIVGFVGVGRNIAERRRAEQASQQSEARYRMLFESNPSPMWVHDLETQKYLLVNSAAINHYGYSTEEFLSMKVDDIAPPYTMQTGKTYHNQHRKKNGTSFEAEVISHDFVFGNRRARLVLVNDITERKRAEEAVRVSEEKYRRFFEEDLTGYMHATADGRIRVCNPAFVRIFGFSSAEEALGSNVRALFPSARAYDSFIRQLRVNRRMENHEEQLIRFDGKAVFVIENTIGMFDSNGQLTDIRTYIFDNTERKKLEDQLRQAQKMENLGSLAGGIAHDFNNILAIILAHTGALSRAHMNNEKANRSIEALTSAGKRGAALVRQLLTFARKADVVFEPVDVKIALEELAKMLEPTFPKTITIHLRPDPDMPIISADFNQLQQLLLNLCVNARDAMSNGGTLTLATQALPRAVVARKFPEATEEFYVCITVIDTGTGMDEATKARIFEPFFTTKGIGKGTGLGLAVVYGIVKSHHGFIDIESEPGQGTTFHVYFGAPPKQVDSQQKAWDVQEGHTGGDETILLVEDEDMLLKPIRSLLEENGYHVFVARDGIEAVDVYARNKDMIDLVLSDIGLPKQNGWEAFLQMKELNPKIRAIFASGNFDMDKKAEMLDHGVSKFIQKPYIDQQILWSIRSLLDTKQSAAAR